MLRIIRKLVMSIRGRSVKDEVKWVDVVIRGGAYEDVGEDSFALAQGG